MELRELETVSGIRDFKGVYGFRDINDTISMKRVDIKHGRKVINKFYGEFVVNANTHRLCVLVPRFVVMTDSKTLTVKSGDYFIGKRQINLLNPMHTSSDYVCICEFESTNTEERVCREISESDIDMDQKMPYIVYPFCVNPIVSMKRVYMIQNRKVTAHFYAEPLIIDANSNMKFILPAFETVQKNWDTEILSGDYFIGHKQVRLSNPIRTASNKSIICNAELI